MATPAQIAAAYRRITARTQPRLVVAHLGPCEEFTGAGAVRGGYGVIHVTTGETMQTHRLVELHRHGPIPKGIEVSHRCDNPPCTRDSHLRRCTHAENMADMAAKNRAHRPLGIYEGEANPAAIITAETASLIRLRYFTERITQRQLADAYGVTHQSVSLIISRATWAHVA